MIKLHLPSCIASCGQLKGRNYSGALTSQKKVRSFACGVPKSAGKLFSPSVTRSSGSLIFAAAQSVVNRSQDDSSVLVSLRPYGIFPGQRTKKGTRTPPYNKLPFWPRYGPEDPTEK